MPTENERMNRQLEFHGLNIMPRTLDERRERAKTHPRPSKAQLRAAVIIREAEQDAEKMRADAERETAELHAELGRLARWRPQAPRGRGRPRAALTPAIARLVLADVNAGMSVRAIVEKYSCFSKSWLNKVVNNGWLEEMCHDDDIANDIAPTIQDSPPGDYIPWSANPHPGGYVPT